MLRGMRQTALRTRPERRIAGSILQETESFLGKELSRTLHLHLWENDAILRKTWHRNHPAIWWLPKVCMEHRGKHEKMWNTVVVNGDTVSSTPCGNGIKDIPRTRKGDFSRLKTVEIKNINGGTGVGWRVHVRFKSILDFWVPTNRQIKQAINEYVIHVFGKRVVEPLSYEPRKSEPFNQSKSISLLYTKNAWWI